MVSRDSGTRVLGGLEADLSLPHSDLVPIDKGVLGDLGAVDLRTVGRPQVDEHVGVALAPNLGVAPADVGVVEHDVALGQPPDRDRIVPDGYPPAIRE